MSSRQTASRTRGIADGEPVRCFCGGAEFDYSFARFPMVHVSRCKTCGLEHRCELKLTPAKTTASHGPAESPPLGFPPFWY